MKLLVTGGGGYIGSHLVKKLQKENHEVVVIDNFSTGNRWAVKNCEIHEIDLLDKDKLFFYFKNVKFDGVFHLAAKSIVSESFQIPEAYHLNNVIGTQNVLELMSVLNTEKIVFSSTAAVFGAPLENKISEDHLKKPISPYGLSKLKAEEVLQEYSTNRKLKSISLRYFNAAGAEHEGKIGEFHNPETHLIPNICNSLIKQDKKLKVFGSNYDTYDGTCIRDYIHVSDIVAAHLKAFEKLNSKNFSMEYNLGNSIGFSILEIIRVAEKISGKKLNFSFVEKRADEPSILIANNNKAIKELEWNINYSDISEIISTALNWHKNFNKGVHLN